MPNRRLQSRPQKLRSDAAALYEVLRDLIGTAQQRNPSVVCAWGVTITECHALELLSREGESRLSELAERLNLDKSTTSRAVTSLRKKGLITRSTHPDDARAVRLSLTAAGIRTCEELKEANIESYAALLSQIEASGRATMLDALRKTAQLVRELKPQTLTEQPRRKNRSTRRRV